MINLAKWVKYFVAAAVTAKSAPQRPVVAELCHPTLYADAVLASARILAVLHDLPELALAVSRAQDKLAEPFMVDVYIIDQKARCTFGDVYPSDKDGAMCLSRTSHAAEVVAEYVLGWEPVALYKRHNKAAHLEIWGGPAVGAFLEEMAERLQVSLQRSADAKWREFDLTEKWALDFAKRYSHECRENYKVFKSRLTLDTVHGPSPYMYREVPKPKDEVKRLVTTMAKFTAILTPQQRIAVAEVLAEL